MQTNGDKPAGKPADIKGALLLGGFSIFMGGIAFLIGIGVIPSGNVEHSSGSYALSAGAGLLFIFLGAMVIVREFGGAKNREDIPASAPLALRLGEQLLSIVLIAIFAAICSVVAFGPFFAGGALPDAGGGSGAIFRIVMGLFAVVLWYAAIYLALSRLRKFARGSDAKPE